MIVDEVFKAYCAPLSARGSGLVFAVAFGSTSFGKSEGENDGSARSLLTLARSGTTVEEMISKDEVRSKALELDIEPANVERDYVFGWLLNGIYSMSRLKDVLVLKGGNAFRKAYFPNTRFSNDLDFSTQAAIDETFLVAELNRVCEYVQNATGVVFETDRTQVEEKPFAHTTRRIYQARLYFKDFFGNPDSITISVRLDIAEFDRVYLPVQTRNLIHPYSDQAQCTAAIRCLKLEELLALKLKCLLQRRHSFDLYDYVHAIFINNELAVDRGEIVRTFLKRTIFEPSPGVVANLLLGLPFEVFRAAWNRYIVSPKTSRIDFETALTQFSASVHDLFGSLSTGYGELAYFPAELRNPIIDAGCGMKLIAITYEGARRVCEPYSLVYKRRKDGHGQEYLYVWDRTGGHTSDPGIKTFVHSKIEGLEPLEERFEPRFPVELSKAGEYGDRTYFGKPFGAGRVASVGRQSLTRRVYGGVTYVIECIYCGKQFRRRTTTTRLRKHKDRYGNSCFGRGGRLVDRIY